MEASVMTEKLRKLVHDVLKDEAKKGETTRRGAIALTMKRIERGGGGKHYGLGPAYLHMAMTHIVGGVVTQEMKSGLPDNMIAYALPNAPPALVQIMSKLPAWIALAEGPNAKWVPSLKATPEDWLANFQLKNYKARQTQKKADFSKNIADYLVEYGLRSLSDVCEQPEMA